MEEDEKTSLQCCRIHLPADIDEKSYEMREEDDVDSEIEDYLVYDVVSQICIVCEVVLASPSRGPLCKRCHAFMYPDYTILQREFDELRSKSSNVCKQIPYGRYSRQDREKFPRFRPRHRCGKDSLLKREWSDENGCGSTKVPANVTFPPVLCFSDSESDDCDEGDVFLGLAQLAIFDKDFSARDQFCSNELQDAMIKDDLVECFPTEILMHIFSYLDENGLYKASQVCQRWRMLTDGMENWSIIFEKKWPLFRPVGAVKCWRDLYVKMMEASTCVTCLEEGYTHKRVVVDDVPNAWRNKRLRSELKQLLVDPPDGIRACPVDDEYSNWQASITGPPDSVYENGVFYLHLELPRSYPMCPPRVRFLTRILHPNVNRHGDIGIDCLRQNWSLALTIPKILVSIQSLLTDPYCHVCMEHVVGRMYTEDREYFNIVARDWTRKFAQHHYQNPELKPITIW